MLTSTLLPIFGIAVIISASPLKHTTSASTVKKNAYGAISASDLINIAPDTKSCDGADFPDECRNADVAANNIPCSFRKFGIESFGAQAALVAIMLFESGDFKYNKNHFPAPGTPGQGTRNMQSPAFNQKYAEWAAANTEYSGVTQAQVDKANAEGPAAVLELVNTDKLSFGSAAWFLATQCNASIQEGLEAGTETGWNNYITQCVGTTNTEDRIAGWKKIIALGHW